MLLAVCLSCQPPAGQMSYRSNSTARMPLHGTFCSSKHPDANQVFSTSLRDASELQPVHRSPAATLSEMPGVWRFTTVSGVIYSAGYAYLVNSLLVSQISCRLNTTTRMTMNRVSILTTPSRQFCDGTIHFLFKLFKKTGHGELI